MDIVRLCVLAGEDLAVFAAHHFDVDALVRRRGIAVVRPEEGAHAHLLSGRRELCDALCRNFDYFAGTEFAIVGIAELAIGKTFERGAVAFGPLAYLNGQPAHLVPGGYYGAVVGEKQYRSSAVYALLSVAYALNVRILGVDEGGYEFVGVDLAARHCIEIAAAGEYLCHELIGVVYDAYSAYGVLARLRYQEQRLRVGVAYAADSRFAAHVGKHPFELGSEGGIFYVVYLALKADLTVEGGHAAALCAQVRMIVGADERIEHRAAVFYRTEETTHPAYSPVRRLNTSL